MQKKILIATGIYPPQIGGPATYSKLLKNKLPERGFSVRVVNFGDFLWLPKVVRHIAYFCKVFLRGFFTDIIYAQDPVSVGLPAMLAAKILRKEFYLKVVGDYAWEQFQIENKNLKSLEEFQDEAFDWRTEIRRKIERFVAQHAEKVIVPSEYLKKIVLLWGVEEGRVRVIYNGFKAPEIAEGRALLRKKLGINGYAILSIGRLVPWKGFHALVEVMPSLLKRISDVHLLIAGDGPERGVLEKKIAELGLEKHVTLLGKLAQEDLFAYIKASDVFALNTAYEGFSHQLLEVAALGTPIITTPVGGNVEIIKDRENGLLVPHNDVRALEKAIIELSGNTTLASSLSRAAMEKVKEYSDERMLNALAQELMSRKKIEDLTVLSISSDRKVFDEGSAVRARLLEYGRLADELRVIVFAKKSLGFVDETIHPNIFLYPTHSLGRFSHIPAAVMRAYRLKRSGVSIDVVTVQDPFECGLAGYFIARLFGAHLHLQIHTDFMSPYFARESFLSRARVFVAKFLLPRADAIRVVSVRIKNSLLAIGYKLPTISILPIFVDINHIARMPIAHDLKKKYPQFEKHILMASRLSPEKNIELAIRAMREVVKRYPKAGLVVVGSGAEEASLKKLVAELALEKSIVFKEWQDNLSSYYKTADLFLFTSNYEGYGMTVVEAIAAGCPVVMTDVGCAGEIVRDEENGLVVSVGDKDTIADAILRVISGDVKLKPELPKMPTKEEYLASYKKSWEDAM